jgi:hypothetical protein
MLIRNLALHFYARNGGPYPSLPAFVEELVAKPPLAFGLTPSSV